MLRLRTRIAQKLPVFTEGHLDHVTLHRTVATEEHSGKSGFDGILRVFVVEGGTNVPRTITSTGWLGTRHNTQVLPQSTDFHNSHTSSVTCTLCQDQGE